MSIFKSHNQQNMEQTIDKKALAFGLISVFLCGIGFGVIAPVVPFLVQPYVSTPEEQATFVTLLLSAYAFCVFFAAPGIGVLSDRYGRRPVLLLCFLGSAIGYLIFGIGGALWVLFAGRIIEGVTGGEISAIFAYFADITPQEHRTKYFGWASAFVGAGTIIGPALGGLLANFGYSVPIFFGAAITLLNLAFGFFFMPESLEKAKRIKRISPIRLNPFTQLASILSMKTLTRLFISAFLLWIPAGSLQGIVSQFTIDAFNWEPVLIGLIFSIIGLQDIVSQGLIMPQLLKKLSDKQIVRLGMISEIIAYAFIAASSLFSFVPLFIIGIFIFGFGDSIFGPAYNGLLSKSVEPNEQGRVQGGSQSIQALARIIGPIIGGQIYILLGHSAPAIMGIILIAAAITVLYKRT